MYSSHMIILDSIKKNYTSLKVSLSLMQVSVLTNEGGRLKRNTMLARGRDFEILPDPVWRALSTWYGGTPALPRTVSLMLNV